MSTALADWICPHILKKLRVMLLWRPTHSTSKFLQVNYFKVLKFGEKFLYDAELAVMLNGKQRTSENTYEHFRIVFA